MEGEKIKWYFLLFIDSVLFIVAMLIKVYALNIIVIGLSFYIYKIGNPVLFKEYDEKQKEKIEKAKLIRRAAQETIRSGKLLNKGKEE